MALPGNPQPSGNAVPLPPYPERFYAAAQYAAVPGTVEVDPELVHAAKFSDLTSLMLYSLYQQAAHGPCTTQKPWGWNVIESAKWASWKELGNMAPVEAMRLFIRTLEALGSGGNFAAEAGLPASYPPSASANGSASRDSSEKVIVFAEELRKLANNQWKPPTTFGRKPSARYQHAAAVVGRKMFVIGGNANGRYLSDLQVLDLTNLAWSKVDPGASIDPLVPCAGHSLLVKDQRTLLLVAGHSKDASQKVQVRVYDIEANSWSILKTRGQVPPARGGQTVTQVGNALWLFGGEDLKRKLLNDVYVLDLATNVWELLETTGAPPSPRADHATTITDEGNLLVFGGGSHSFCYNDIYLLNTQTNEWSQPETKGELPAPRAGHAGVLVGTSWFLIGGGDTKGGVTDTVTLDVVSLEWSVVAEAPAKTSIASEGVSAVRAGPINEAIVVTFGGYNGRYSNEVYAYKPTVKASTPRPKANGEASATAQPSSSQSTQQDNGQGSAAARQEAEASAAAAAAAAEEEAAAQTAAEEAASKAKLSSSRSMEVQKQLEEAEANSARIESIALNARAEAEYAAAKAKADAWAAVGKAKKEAEDLKEKLAAALRSKQVAEEETRDAEAAAVNAQVQASGAQAEASRLRKDLADARVALEDAQNMVARVQEDAELTKLQRDYSTVKASLADTQQVHAAAAPFFSRAGPVELLSARGSLASEQARCFRLEVEVAELRQRLQTMDALEHELELLRRQKAAIDEAAAAAAQKGTPGVWGWLAPGASK
eukprot:jgi/Mesen1/10759/ME000909S10083